MGVLDYIKNMVWDIHDIFHNIIVLFVFVGNFHLLIASALFLEVNQSLLDYRIAIGTF